MALYLSNSGNFVFNKAVRKSGMDWGEEEGAGSIVGKSGLGVSFHRPTGRHGGIIREDML